jgi:hypothetical protein
MPRSIFRSGSASRGSSAPSDPPGKSRQAEAVAADQPGLAVTLLEHERPDPVAVGRAGCEYLFRLGALDGMALVPTPIVSPGAGCWNSGSTRRALRMFRPNKFSIQS